MMKPDNTSQQATVLIVDDSPTYIQALAKLLKEDYRILVATGGSKALELAGGKQQPDLILLDVEMPLMNGYEVCRLLKADLKTRDIPVIFVTARDQAADEEEGFKLGAVDYIPKPFHPAIVRARVKSQTERRRAEQQILKYTTELELKGAELAELYRRLDTEMDKARLLHEQTLPQSLPAVAGISFAAHYRPAQKLGGDYYDVIQKGQKLIIYLSDVSGHGLDGAMLNIFVKEALNSYISLKPEALQPSRMIQYLQSRYCGEAYPADYFVCIFLAVLELTTMELTYASAGFQSLPLISQNGRQESLHSEGPPISTVFPPEAMLFEENRRHLTPGTTLLFSTDGLLEQVDEHERQYGDTGRLEAVFYQNNHLPPQLLIKQINADFHNYTANSAGIDDDITFLVMQLKPERAETMHLELAGELQTTDSLRQKMEQLLAPIEDRENFITCVLELVHNAIEHGHNFDLEKTVALTITLTETYLQAVVEDQGAGFH